MLIKDIFVLNPDENNLMNDGVVNINTARDENGLKTIRHELKTFVCEGEYQKGIYRILDTYLKFIDQPKQPAVWVSGFFGSGKSHLIKMLAYYWDDFKFPGGETARTLKPLPEDVHERLVELDRRQKIHGRLSVSGTLKDFPSDDIRHSFMQLLLNSLGLPRQFHLFKFIHWAQQEGILGDLRALIEAQGKSFDNELENMFVSSLLASSVLQLKPEFATDEAKVKEAFRAQFKRVERLDRYQLINTIKNEILPMVFGPKIPCTIIVLDEVQQFIGQDSNKTIDIQNLAQDLCDHFDGKFLLVGSGQNALAETPQLSPLKDRFSVTVNLTNTDVETVTRKTILEKKPSMVAEIKQKTENSLGEISRNLAGSAFGYTLEDKATLVADYPILPSTRKFWKKILQVIDTPGTSGQLRSQLRIVDESIKKISDRELGSVVPADFIFEQKQSQLLMNALLFNDTNNLIEGLKASGGNNLLKGRILSMVFLIDKLPSDLPGGRLLSNAANIADLLLDHVNQSSDAFRTKIKELIAELVEKQVLMPVDDEFKLQTKEGTEWEQEFTSHVIRLQNSGEDQIQQVRKEKFVSYIKSKTNSINILQGESRIKRDFDLWIRQERPNTDNRLNVWIRDGWNESETAVLNEIRAEGAASPLAYVFISKLRDQDLRNEIIKYLAASKTLDAQGIPTVPEGQQARKSMETRRNNALQSLTELVEYICREARVYLAGGSMADSGVLTENIREALESIATRQFSEFSNKADKKDWDKVLGLALSKVPDAMKKISFNGEPKEHPAAYEILRFIGHQAKQGKEIRLHFMKAPYGWSQDAIDAILVMLRLTEIVSCSEPDLKVANINHAIFKKEVHTLTATDKMSLRKLYLDAQLQGKPGDEFADSNKLMGLLRQLADKVSGDAPLPEPINTRFISDIENLDGNQRLLLILEQIEDLRAKLRDWKMKALLADARLPKWKLVTELYVFLPQQHNHLKTECDAIREDRLLFLEPDPVEPLLTKITEVLNEAVKTVKSAYNERYDSQMDTLQQSKYFSGLHPDQKHKILVDNQLLAKPEIKHHDAQGLFNQLQKASLETWHTKIAALPGQFQSALEAAIQLSAPKAGLYTLPKQTLNSETEIDEYAERIKTDLKTIIKSSGSVILK